MRFFVLLALIAFWLMVLSLADESWFAAGFCGFAVILFGWFAYEIKHAPTIDDGDEL